MATNCHELKNKIVFGDPFFIITKEKLSGGAIVSIHAMNRVPLTDRISNLLPDNLGVNIYAAASSYSKGDTYSWFDIRKEGFLFSLTESVFSQYFPNCKAMFENAE